MYTLYIYFVYIYEYNYKYINHENKAIKIAMKLTLLLFFV